MSLTPEQARLLADAVLDRPEDDSGGGVIGFEAAAGAEGRAGARLGPGGFGRYRITRLVATGGMGEVYEAEQDHPRRRVAIKVIRPEAMSPELVRRFEHEARVLGRLQHPGIARIYDAGQAETGAGPTPYFAMEYVEGVPLTVYAKEKGLSIRERLELFIKVCEAVEHAHQKGVIHRDLKPANILVDAEGQPRVLDFGVARATDADIRATTLHTDVGRLIGTLPYMSPEQVAGDPDAVDTRSDVYSLGVVLYELLAERAPYEIGRGPVFEAARVILEVEPKALSSVDRALRGDLETLVHTALEKQQSRRYASVAELSLDVRRHLLHEPIRAQRASRVYCARKFVARHRWAVAMGLIATASLVLVTIASVFFSILQHRAHTAAELLRAGEEAQRRLAEHRLAELEAALATAESESARSEAVIGLFGSTLLSLAPSIARGRDVTLRDFLDSVVERLEAGGVQDLRAAAQVRSIVGETYRRLDSRMEAEKHLSAALATQESLLPSGAQELLVTMNNLGALYSTIGRDTEAIDLLRRVVEARTERFGPDHPATLTALNNLAGALEDREDAEIVEAMYRRVYEGRAAALGPGSETSISALLNLANYLRRRGDLARAEPLLRQAISASGEGLAADHPLTFSANRQLGMMLLDLDRSGESLELLEAEAGRCAAVYGADSPQMSMALGALGFALLETGRLEQAEAAMKRNIEIRQVHMGPTDAQTLSARANLAAVLSRQGKNAEAEQIIRDVLENQQALLGPSHPNVLLSQNTLAELVRLRGDYAAAVELSSDILEKARGGVSKPRDAAKFAGVHGRILSDLGRLEEAESHLLGCLSSLRNHGAPAAEVNAALRDLAALYKRWGRLDEAARYEQPEE